MRVIAGFGCMPVGDGAGARARVYMCAWVRACVYMRVVRACACVYACMSNHHKLCDFKLATFAQLANW